MEQKVIDAEVIEETGPQAAPTHGQTEDSVLSRVMMLAFVLALGTGVYLLKDPPRPDPISPAYATTHAPASPVNGSALQRDYRKRHLSPYAGANKASQDLTASMDRAQKQLDEMNQRLERQMVLNEEQFQKYKRRLTEDGYDLSDEETRQMLLKAGYRPPPKQEEAVHGRTMEETATFAKSLVGELVADEVEGFLKRADMITRVGIFLAGEDKKEKKAD
ncbi:MAG: hypothetical protein GC134_05270 [Proteobacteria bacterium]|nr:hypothetical protein [Pseudomonadota bacterium]